MSGPQERKRVNLLACRVCGADLGTAGVAAQGGRCGNCSSEYRIQIFRAAFRNDPAGQPGRALSAEGQSPCYQHAASQAEEACDHCGRYMCALCDVKSFGGHLCLVCTEQMYTDPKNNRFRANYPRLDRIVSTLAFLPIAIALAALLVFFPIFVASGEAAFLGVGIGLGAGIGFFTAPVALGMSFFAWSRSFNPIKTMRGPIVLGAALAVLQLSLFGLLIVAALLEGFS